jgi:class 3 adenylate cyclase
MLAAAVLGRAPSRDELAGELAAADRALWTLVRDATTPDRDARVSAAELCLAVRELLRQEERPPAPAPARTKLGPGSPSPGPARESPSMILRRPAPVSGVASTMLPTAAPLPAPVAEVETPAEIVSGVASTMVGAPAVVAVGTTLGRFRLVKRLGEGGMGEVFQGVDIGDGTTAAVKILRRQYADDPSLLRRFKKEARMLDAVRNPYVANLLDVNTDCGVNFLALEFVEGPSLADVQEREGRLPERAALAIVADVCRALLEAHRHGVIHRDIKPENVMFVSSDPRAALDPNDTRQRVKLCDFGIARSVEREAGTVALTQEGMIVGTPLFMAPEQCSARPCGPPTDVYALGVTLFLLLSGRTPFQYEETMQLLVAHVREAVPALGDLAPDVSAPTAELVARALEKDPARRFADAGEMLDAVEKILRGEPAEIDVHPALPATPPEKLTTYEFAWDLEATPAQLWPYITNTDRMNRVVGMPPPKWEVRGAAGGGSDVTASATIGGANLRWQEHPFEWVEGRRWGSLRVYEKGFVMRWLITDIELVPRPEGGTRLNYRLRLQPKSWFGKLLFAMEIGKQRKKLDAMFRRIDATVTGKLARTPEVDPFTPPVKLGRGVDEQIQGLVAKLLAAGCDARSVEALGALVRHAPDADVARVRPLEFARRYGLHEEKTVEAFLRGTRAGLFTLSWDVICPLCRVPSDFTDSLKSIADHSHCTACNADFKLDFARSIELIFRASPALRPTELRAFCIGGPSNFPHVAAQVRLAPGERFVLPMALEPGQHRVRSPQLPTAVEFSVSPDAGARRLELRLGDAATTGAATAEATTARLGTSGQLFVLTNALDRPLLVRIERMAQRGDALTAARASSMAAFRELFPGEVLAPGRLVSVTAIALLVADIARADALFRELGDARAFAMVLQHFHHVGDAIAAEGGAMIKTVGSGVVAAFERPAAAVRAALRLQAALAADDRTANVRLRVAVHRGSAMAATVNERLDYFGQNVALAMSLPAQIPGGHVLLTRDVVEEPEVPMLLSAWGLRGEAQAVEGREADFWALRIAAPTQPPARGATGAAHAA